MILDEAVMSCPHSRALERSGAAAHWGKVPHDPSIFAGSSILSRKHCKYLQRWRSICDFHHILGRPRREWKDNIEMDLSEVWFKVVDWIHMSEHRGRWWRLVNTV
jgi:hypothetical protein